MDVPIEAEIIPEEDPYEAGYREGAAEMKQQIMELLDTGSDCGEWALDMIEGRS